MFGKLSSRQRRKLEEGGTRAMATVLEVGAHGMTVTSGNEHILDNTEVVLKVRLQVEPDGTPAFEVNERFRFSQFAMPAVGRRLAVIFDPDDHDTIMLDPSGVVVGGMSGGAAMTGDGGVGIESLLATVRDAQAKSGGDRNALGDILRQQFGAAHVIEGRTGFPTAAAEDPIELLAKLSELRDKGLVTDEEFEAQKRRLLGS